MSSRDPQRIDLMIADLAALWRQHPDMRLAQLIVTLANPSEPCPQVFFCEDTKLHQRMTAAAAEAKQAPEAQPRWTRTKRQREARNKDARELSIQGYLSRWYPPGKKTLPQHDCLGMRENGPVVFLSDSAAETDAASKVARDNDYLREGAYWFYRSGRHWCLCIDPGLL